MESLKEISEILGKINSSQEILIFLSEMFTEAEMATLSKRWRILNMLKEGKSQREIAKELNVSLCKITRGAKILKNKDSITAKYLIKENENENTDKK